jgi:hypothetical protein
VPRQPSPWRRLTTATRWPVGVALTSFRYLWRTTPIKRDEEPGDRETDWAPEIPDGVSDEELQRVDDGSGPLFHRRYRIRVRDSGLGPAELMDYVSADLDRVAPTDMASFQKVLGQAGEMQVGDEYVVRMPGPWDGPVRVVLRERERFRLATLATHLEAGQIEFRTRREGDLVVFEIESWARSGDRVANLLYTHLRMAKEIQLHMWTSLLERVTKRSGGRRSGPIEIHTRRVEPAS